MVGLKGTCRKAVNECLISARDNSVKRLEWKYDITDKRTTICMTDPGLAAVHVQKLRDEGTPANVADVNGVGYEFDRLRELAEALRAAQARALAV